MVRQWQEMFYDHNYSQVAITSPNFVKLAEAYKIRSSALIKSKNDLELTLEKIIKKPGPALIECQVAKEDNVLPMVPGGKHLGETITEFK